MKQKINNAIQQPSIDAISQNVVLSLCCYVYRESVDFIVKTCVFRFTLIHFLAQTVFCVTLCCSKSCCRKKFQTIFAFFVLCLLRRIIYPKTCVDVTHLDRRWQSVRFWFALKFQQLWKIILLFSLSSER